MEAETQTDEVKKKVAQITEVEDIVMKDRHEVTKLEEWQPYEDLSSYEEEHVVQVAAPPATKKLAALRLVANAGKKSQRAKKNQVTSVRTSSRAMVIHGIPCQRPLANIIQDVGVKGTMGARWLLGGTRRLEKVTSSVVIFFDRV